MKLTTTPVRTDGAPLSERARTVLRAEEEWLRADVTDRCTQMARRKEGLEVLVARLLPGGRNDALFDIALTQLSDDYNRDLNAENRNDLERIYLIADTLASQMVA
jgi:hypothetical protein